MEPWGPGSAGILPAFFKHADHAGSRQDACAPRCNGSNYSKALGPVLVGINGKCRWRWKKERKMAASQSSLPFWTPVPVT